ncbi:MAG: DUF523 domain-containing protein [Elusimicrobiota bacterium]|jgi:uncharacterized protein YbbK (DUF523 family)
MPASFDRRRPLAAAFLTCAALFLAAAGPCSAQQQVGAALLRGAAGATPTFSVRTVRFDVPAVGSLGAGQAFSVTALPTLKSGPGLILSAGAASMETALPKPAASALLLPGAQPAVGAAFSAAAKGLSAAEASFAEVSVVHSGALAADVRRVNLRFAELKAAFGRRSVEDVDAGAADGALVSPVRLSRPAVPSAKPALSAGLPIPAVPEPKGLLAKLAALFTKLFFPPVLCSACLLALHVRYDGKDLVPDERLLKLFAKGRVIVICPEMEGGLPIPREPANVVGGTGADVLDGRARVLTASGRDVTDAFVRGAQIALAKAKAAGCRAAYMKTRSPSCGDGLGVTAALLARNGIRILPIDAPRA